MQLGVIEAALGGIGLFLLGLRLLSEGIRTVADSTIRGLFSRLTGNRFSAVCMGLLAALTLNSVTASLLLVIALVSGGMLGVFQAVNVTAGILCGATLSLHLHLIPTNVVSAPLIFIGVLLRFFAHRRRIANAGNLILGVGLLFFGLTLLEGGFRPFEHHPLYALFSGAFFHDVIPATFFGAFISFLLQSAGSSVTIISSLATSYGIPLQTAFSMVLGGFLGVAAIVFLASLGGQTAMARRVVFPYLIVTVLVMVILLPGAVLFPRGLDLILPYLPDGARCDDTLFQCQLTMLHTFATMLIAFPLVLFSGVISRWSDVASLQSATLGGAAQSRAAYLDKRILNTPTLAIEQVRKEILRMMSVARYMYGDVCEIMFDFDVRRADTIRQHEQVLDALNHEITEFLAAISRSKGYSDVAGEIPKLFQTVTDLEHMGDRCEKILDSILSRKESGIQFSGQAMDDLERLAAAVGHVVAGAEEVLSSSRGEAGRDYRVAIDTARDIYEKAKREHFTRISRGVCPPRGAMVFNDMIHAWAGIAELCWNITVSHRKST